MFTLKNGARFKLLATTFLCVFALAAASAARAASPRALLASHAGIGAAESNGDFMARKASPALGLGNVAAGILPPGSSAYGKSYGDWGAAWWQWAIAIPYGTNPIFDPDGGAQGQNQSGPVWFLAGNPGGFTERSVQVPAGKGIFVPLINLANDYPCPDPNFQPAPGQSLYDFLAEGAAAVLAYVDGLNAELDGTPLVDLFDYRGTSRLSTFTGDPSLQPTFDGCITGTPQPFVSDGYWLMLRPLTPGMHTLHLTSSAFGGGFTLEMLYHINVVNGGGLVQASDAEQQSGSPASDHAAAISPKRPGTTWGALKTIYR